MSIVADYLAVQRGAQSRIHKHPCGGITGAFRTTKGAIMVTFNEGTAKRLTFSVSLKNGWLPTWFYAAIKLRSKYYRAHGGRSWL